MRAVFVVQRNRNGERTSSTVLLRAVRLWTWRLHARISSRLLLIAAVLLLPAKLLLLLLVVLLQLLLLHPVVVHLLLQPSKQPVRSKKIQIWCSVFAGSICPAASEDLCKSLSLESNFQKPSRFLRWVQSLPSTVLKTPERVWGQYPLFVFSCRPGWVW